MKLLDRSLKYIRHYKHKEWIESLAIEADTAISKTQETDQKRVRQTVANNIKKLVEMRHKRPHRRNTEYTLRGKTKQNHSDMPKKASEKKLKTNKS
jgi:ribosomal protein S13